MPDRDYCVQIAFGVLAYVVRLNHWDSAPTGVLVASTVTHVAFGALTLASCIALTLEVFYHVRPRAGDGIGSAGRLSMNDYVQLTKPQDHLADSDEHGCRLLFWSRTGWSWLVLLHTTIGTGLIASGTAALNQWWEREADARMPRTQKRPLPSHRITPRNALCSASRLSILGFVELWLGANLLTARPRRIHAGELLYSSTRL